MSETQTTPLVELLKDRTEVAAEAALSRSYHAAMAGHTWTLEDHRSLTNAIDQYRQAAAITEVVIDELGASERVAQQRSSARRNSTDTEGAEHAK